MVLFYHIFVEYLWKGEIIIVYLCALSETFLHSHPLQTGKKYFAYFVGKWEYIYLCN